MVNARHLVAIFFAALLLAPATDARQVIDEPLLVPLAAIERQASRVQSAKAAFAVRYLPSTPEEMRRINLYFRAHDQEYRAGSHFWSEHQARRRSYRSTWLRKGVKEREERANVARPAVTEIIVFDGQVVRTLDNSPFRSCLYIAPADFQWNHQNRIQPFAFAFEFRALPHGAIIRRSGERRVAPWIQLEEQGVEIVARHPLEERLLLKFVLDEQHRLVAREAILTRSSNALTLENEQPTIYSRHEFMDHKPYHDGQGGTIWFPSKAMLRYYLGTLADGSPVQSYAIQVDITDIEFNGDIPDEKFEIQPPDGVTIFDQRGDHFGVAPYSY